MPTGAPELHREHAPAPVIGHAAWMAAAAEEYRRLVELLRTLDEDDWSRPTDCTAWDVRMLASHLVGAAESTASVVEMVRQLRGGRRLGERGIPVDAMNAFQVHERLTMPPRQLVEDLVAASARGVRARSRIPSLLRAVPLPFGPPLGTRPLGYLMDCIYTRDAWIHRVDLARATGREMVLTPEHDGAMVSDMVSEWAAAHGEPFHLALTGPVGGQWQAGSAGPSIEIDAVEFARVLSGRGQRAGLRSHLIPF